jgi:hypothetical protein
VLDTEAAEPLLLPELPEPELLELALVVAGELLAVVCAEPVAVGDEVEVEILPPGSTVLDNEVISVYWTISSRRSRKAALKLAYLSRRTAAHYNTSCSGCCNWRSSHYRSEARVSAESRSIRNEGIALSSERAENVIRARRCGISVNRRCIVPGIIIADTTEYDRGDRSIGCDLRSARLDNRFDRRAAWI